MIDLLKKTAFMGLGVTAKVKEKVEELARDLVNKGSLTEQEGAKFVDEILEKSAQVQSDLSAMLDKKIDATLSKMDLVKKSEYDDLAGQVAQLHAELAKLKEDATAKTVD